MPPTCPACARELDAGGSRCPGCGAALAETPPPRQALGDFEIVREVGRGGMGVVYEAVQRSLNRRVALKVLSAALGLTPRAVERFRREAEAAARLHHTNIVPVYATGEQDGVHFYAMELIDGPSLDRVLDGLRLARQGPARAGRPGDPTVPAAAQPTHAGEVLATLPYAQPVPSPLPAPAGSALPAGADYFDAAARMIADVADALEHAHRQGVLHRDVKPANLLLSPDGRLSVNDFGLARLLEQPGMTMTGEFIGTPAYMSPEQVASAAAIDHRSDVYSLGATLYELLTLRPPFAGDRIEQVLARVAQEEPAAPRRLNPAVPRDLETICLKALEKDPARRYQTAGALADDLRRYVQRFAISARRVGPLGRLARWARRRPALAAALACSLVLAAAAGFFAWQSHATAARWRAEQRQHALEKALVAAMNGRFAEAEDALGQAEGLGASAGELRLWRGQVALYRGDTGAAREHLEEAVRLLPDSVAARAALAQAYSDGHRLDLYYESLAGLDRLPAVTPEDYLLKGQAIALLDPGQALPLLDRAIRRRDSSVARLVRAQVLTEQASVTGDPADAERALADASVARAMLPGTPVPLARSAYANLTAHALYDERGQPARARAALEQARRDAEALGPFTSFPGAWSVRALYFHRVEDGEALWREFRRAQKHKGIPLPGTYYVHWLLRRGEYARAREALEQVQAFRGGDARLDYFLPFYLALLPGGRDEALAAYRAGLKAAVPRSQEVERHMPLLLLGPQEDAAKAFRAAREKGLGLPAAGAWYEKHSEFLAGELTAEGLLRAAGASRRNLCEAHYLIAMTRLAGGARAGAREHFQRALDTRVLFFLETEWSRTFLERLKSDPAWPAWIPARK
jgi:serine/threonine protein kinase/Tfp pilus assembly protein PilF